MKHRMNLGSKGKWSEETNTGGQTTIVVLRFKVVDTKYKIDNDRTPSGHPYNVRANHQDDGWDLQSPKVYLRIRKLLEGEKVFLCDLQMKKKQT